MEPPSQIYCFKNLKLYCREKIEDIWILLTHISSFVLPNVPLFSFVPTFENLRSGFYIIFFYCKLAQKSLFFFKMWRLSFKNTRALSVKFILPLFPLPVFCAMTCRNPLSCWEPMCYGSVLSVSCFLWSRGGLCSLFFSLFLPVIVCMWGVSVIFIFSSVCFSALWIPSSTLSLSVFYFFNL